MIEILVGVKLISEICIDAVFKFICFEIWGVYILNLFSIKIVELLYICLNLVIIVE